MRQNEEAVSRQVGGGSGLAALTSLLLSATSLWLLRMFSSLHWQVLFGDHREGIAPEPLAVLFGLLGQLDLGYRLFALAAVAFNVWALWKGRPRWLALVALPPALLAFCTAGLVQ